MTTATTIVGLVAVAALVAMIGGLTRYAMEFHRAAGRIVDATERAMFWRGFEAALESGPWWRGMLLQQIHRLVGGLKRRGTVTISWPR